MQQVCIDVLLCAHVNVLQVLLLLVLLIEWCENIKTSDQVSLASEHKRLHMFPVAQYTMNVDVPAARFAVWLVVQCFLLTKAFGFAEFFAGAAAVSRCIRLSGIKTATYDINRSSIAMDWNSNAGFTPSPQMPTRAVDGVMCCMPVQSFAEKCMLCC